ncbi:MAG: MerR family transcriptional regulator [Atopobiaceae bacterium]|nr:MerR family transcriptional regulator [Atopobiaceae bacterium]
MSMSVSEFAEVTGVSVRTLHYYDEIGLLKPAFVDDTTGYRYYDGSSILRMQEILFYRELDFPLKSIAEMLSFPHYDISQALKEQKHLLILKKERLERLIHAIDGALKGENVMAAFDNSEFETYQQEAKERWGQTEAYSQYEEKAKGASQAELSALGEGMNNIMAEFATCMSTGNASNSAEAQELVLSLQSYITEHYYDCTNQILAGLGQMYVCDERFKRSIDAHGDGTAEFISEAIKVHCSD